MVSDIIAIVSPGVGAWRDDLTKAILGVLPLPALHSAPFLVPFQSLILPSRQAIDADVWRSLLQEAIHSEDIPPIKVRAFDQGFLPSTDLDRGRLLARLALTEDSIISVGYLVAVEVED